VVDLNAILALASFTGSLLAAVATLAYWLSTRFRSVERLVVQEMRDHDKKDDHRFGGIYDRLTRIEVQAGLPRAPVNGGGHVTRR
jgi:hypothetical protein